MKIFAWNEIKLLQILDGTEGVVKFHGFHEIRDVLIMLAFDFLNGFNLHQYLKLRGNFLREAEVETIARSVVYGKPCMSSSVQNVFVTLPILLPIN